MTSAPVELLRTAHDRARHAAALQLRARVAGEDASSRAAAIWAAEGERWFGPADPIWKVHIDASMFVAGIRALLLQSLHPLAMAGVDQHSTYRDDPWARLQQTSNFISTTTFGTVTDAERLLARIRGIHRRVHGTAADGRAYRADDPHLLLWVHAAEADSFLRCHQRFGARPLSNADADRYVAQIGSVSARLGMQPVPQTVVDLEATIAAFRKELEGSALARSVVRFLLWDPPMSWAARPGYLTLVAGAIGTLPAWARDLLGIRLPPGGPATLSAAGSLGAVAIRWMLSDPQVAAERRLGHEA